MKAIIFSTFAGWLARILAIALNIAGLPLALDKLGQSRFGLFLVVLSIGSWIGFANIGMGRVVANVIAKYSIRSPAFVARFVSMATVLAAIINLLLFCLSSALFLTVITVAPLNEAIAHDYVEFVVTVLGMFLALSLWFFLSVFEGIDAGHHQLHRLYLFQLASYALSLFLLVAVFPRHPSIGFAACLLNLGFLLGSIAHGFDVARRNRALFIRRFAWRRKSVRVLLLSTLDFTIISLGIGILYQLSTGLFGFIAGPDAVVELGIFMRLLQSYGALLIAFTFPLTSVIASRLASRNVAAALQAARWSGLLLLGGAAAASSIFFVFANRLLALWLRSGIQFESAFLLCASLLIFLSSLHFYLAALLMGGGDTKMVARIHLGEALVFAPIAYLLFSALQQTGILIALDATIACGSLLMVRRLHLHHLLSPLVGIGRLRTGWRMRAFSCDVETCDVETGSRQETASK
jgi:O-antigen/teichoic acid export membrane protein